MVGSRFMKIRKKNNIHKNVKERSSKNINSHVNPDFMIDFVPSKLATPNQDKQPEIYRANDDSASN